MRNSVNVENERKNLQRSGKSDSELLFGFFLSKNRLKHTDFDLSSCSSTLLKGRCHEIGAGS